MKVPDTEHRTKGRREQETVFRVCWPGSQCGLGVPLNPQPCLTSASRFAQWHLLEVGRSVRLTLVLTLG